VERKTTINPLNLNYFLTKTPSYPQETAALRGYFDKWLRTPPLRFNLFLSCLPSTAILRAIEQEGRNANRPPARPLRDRNETSLAAALCLLLELSRSQAQMLTKLMACDYATPEELHIAANRAITPSSMSTLICELRKKLGRYGIEITTLYRLGYGLRRGAREKICQLLVEYDAGFITPPEGSPKRRGCAQQESLTS
jgi:hypothetical protein